MKLIFGCATDAGNYREKNQDAVVTCSGFLGNRQLAVAAVFDGIGSLQNSEISSQFMSEGVNSWLSGLISSCPADMAETAIVSDLELTLNELNELVYEHQLKEEIGCTMSVLLTIDRHYYVFHMGDSRIYRYRDNTLQQITVDHTVKIEVGGKIKSALDNYVGKRPKPEVYKIDGEIAPNDIFVLGSDGLYKRLQPGDLTNRVKSIRTNDDATEYCTALIKEMLDRGEKDNISSVIVYFRKKTLFMR